MRSDGVPLRLGCLSSILYSQCASLVQTLQSLSIEPGQRGQCDVGLRVTLIQSHYHLMSLHVRGSSRASTSDSDSWLLYLDCHYSLRVLVR